MPVAVGKACKILRTGGSYVSSENWIVGGR